MSLRLTTPVVLVFVFLAGLLFAADKKEARITRLGDIPAEQLNYVPYLSAADTCEARNDNGMVWRIDGWVYGAELYKSYIDPEVTCPDPYPYTVTAINMPMIFDDATDIVVSVDVEMVDDTSYPGCHFPGILTAISTDYALQVPDGGGLFDIWIPLDTPVVVNGPFFAGFYIDNVLDTAAHAALICDSVPVQCVSWNIWDIDLGFVDLTDNGYYDFPGRLVLYAAGIPGGGGGGGGDTTEPAPQVAFASPGYGSLLYGNTELWAEDTTGSDIIDFIVFSYSTGGGAFTEIGRDFDGISPLRNGVSTTVTGTGYSLPWDFSSLSEGQYTLRATVYDTLGRSDYEDITVVLEPTPPVPRITSPAEGTDFCKQLDMLMACSDENLTYMQIDRFDAQDNYTVGVATLNQFSVGDNNGNPGDGNRASNGEFGDYYCAPVAAAIVAKVWYDRGFLDIMKINGTYVGLSALAEAMAAEFNTRENLGTYDEDVVRGLRTYCEQHGNDLIVDYKRNPEYLDLRKWVEEDERSVMIALGGTPGSWMAVNGFKGWAQTDTSYTISVSIPMAGIIQDVKFKRSGGVSRIFFGGTWHPVDIMVSLLALGWDVPHPVVGVDFNGGNGWSLSWVPTGLIEGNHYYFRASTQDGTLYLGSSSTLFRYRCTGLYTAGDYNNDKITNLADLYYLISFITQDGAPPAGGAERADANCDGLVNVVDIVYYLNYLYGSSPAPCQ